MAVSRIAILGMPRLLHQLVTETVAQLPDVTIVVDRPEVGLAANLPEVDADIYLVDYEQAPTAKIAAVLFGPRRAKVLTVSADGRRAFLHELRPHTRPLGELSAAGLLDVIRQR